MDNNQHIPNPRNAADCRGSTALLEAITEFRSVTTAQALVDQAPEVIARLGFDRVLISRIDNGIWVPESMFVRCDQRWAQAIIQAGREEPTALESVVEADVVDSANTFVVDEVQTHPRVHRSIAAVSRSDNYGVAPIVIEQSVVGMVHADRYVQGQRVFREECELLAVAAESLAVHLSRLVLLQQLQAVRETAGRSWPTVTPSVPSQSRMPNRRIPPGQELTDRELDVMRLMSAGQTNYRIARRLDISEGTVKTHVSKILQKLNAANRAQAVSLWLVSRGPSH
ncbi:LuxR C-terminal-related transcriptional regulator [Nocardia vaccinii]|uniref:LuxR C-terminal-related transcriptional regulator n=1 Tax=Nocardia vaccinii TaxID=1822 RepID=UPI0008366483|nr:LuxR C-terminal-related transcriptional regulator [Nocardia vaccinii]